MKRDGRYSLVNSSVYLRWRRLRELRRGGDVVNLVVLLPFSEDGQRHLVKGCRIRRSR